MSLPAGTRLAVYEITELIGQGGMGEVYRARDTKLGRDVAIKVLPEAVAGDRDRLRRFEREARLLAQLNHPNIATLYGLEDQDGTTFLVMELVEGETLAERIARGPIGVDEALAIFVQITDGLHAAHGKGIIHRDLKPANIRITPEGQIKILDFGLAKVFATDEAVSAEISQSPTLTKGTRLRQGFGEAGTQLGAVVGTASYMSPEQARGKPIDKRTDIWAFGCCLFEVLTGSRAFSGDNVTDVLAAVVQYEPAWERLPPSTPVAWRRLVTRCLRKDPTDRLHDVADARLELQAVDDEPLAPRSPESRRWTWPAIAAVALAVGALLGSGARLGRDRPTGPVVHTEISLPSGSSLALYSTTSVAISADGRLVAFVAESDGSRHLYLRRLDSPESERLEGTGDARMPFFSPDGRWVGFFARRQLKKIAVTGGAPITICDAGDVRGATWASNDEIIFTPSLIDGLHRIASEGGEPTVLTTLRRDEREKSHRMPAALPNGKGVLFVVGSADITSFDDARIEVLSFETGERSVLVDGGTSPRYSPTGHLLYARSDKILAAPFDQDTMQVTGPPTTVLEGVVVSPVWGTAELGVSRNGSLVFARGQVWGLDYRVMRVDRTGRSEELFPTPGAFEMPRWSPDGKRIAIAEAGATDSVWLFDVDRGTLGPFATGWDNTDPVWSPDGQWIAYRSNRGGEEFDVYRKKSDGSGVAERLAEHELRERPTSWSRDGKTLLIRQGHPKTGNDILTLSLDERELQPLLRTEANEPDAAFSPDGRWIAFVSDESGRFEVYVVPASSPDVKTMVSIGGGVKPRWNPNGGGELFYRSGDAFFAVTVTEGDRLSVGTPRKLFEQRALFDAYDVSPDGRHFVLVDDSDAPPPPTRLELVQNWFQELERLVPREP